MGRESNPTSGFENLIAGASAGAIESFITYPTEYIKTRQQLAAGVGRSSPWKILKETLDQKGSFRLLYGGAGAFCVSNASKSGVRFFTFDAVRSRLWTDQKTGKPTTQANLTAGLFAGVAESVLVVTPGETIKTKIIDDRQRPGGPQFRGSIDAIRQLLRTEGFSGVYQGVIPVTLKQASNAMVRFTSYNWFLERIRELSGERYKSLHSVFAGSFAGIVTVYCTMPFDTLKTRLQSLSDGARPRGTISCLQSILKNEGLTVLWKGTTPRLTRLTISGAISFTVYEQTLMLLKSLEHETKIQSLSAAA